MKMRKNKNEKCHGMFDIKSFCKVCLNQCGRTGND